MWLDPLLNIRKCFPLSSPQVSRRTERAAIVRLSPAGSSKLLKCSHLLQPSLQRNKALIRYLLCIVIVNHVQLEILWLNVISALSDRQTSPALLLSFVPRASFATLSTHYRDSSLICLEGERTHLYHWPPRFGRSSLLPPPPRLLHRYKRDSMGGGLTCWINIAI